MVARLHQGMPLHRAGVPLESARAAMIMVHGRGAAPSDILSVAPYLELDQVAYLAPQAAGNTWYPQRFFQPEVLSDPHLASALEAVGEAVRQAEAAGIPRERTFLLGFSQGACLALEYAARHATRYGGVFGLSGALIGPANTPRDYAGTLAGTPVFLGCDVQDPHIPAPFVHESEAILRNLGADVTKRLYRGLGHSISADELDFVRTTVQAAIAGGEDKA